MSQSGRWTVIARAPSRARRPSVPKLRTRVFVRCVCGTEKIVWLEDIELGRSTGCESRRCAARWLAAQDIREMLAGWVRRELDVIQQVMQLGGAEADVAMLEQLERDRTRRIDDAIADYLRSQSHTRVDVLAPQRPTRVFVRRA